MIPAMLVLDNFPEIGLDIIPFDTVPFSQYEFYKKIILDIHHMNMLILNLTIFFWNVSIWAMDNRWTFAGQGWAPWDRYCYWWAPENVMTIGKPLWSLSRGTLFSVTLSKNITAFFCKISAGITAFRRKIAAVNLNSQEKFYDKAYRRFLED